MAQVIRRTVSATNQRIGVNNFDTDAGASWSGISKCWRNDKT